MSKALIHMKDGKYAIRLEALKKDADEASAMANYLSQMAVVTKQEDVVTLSLLLQSQQTITGLQVEGSSGELIEAVERQIDEEMDRRFEMFELAQLPTVLPVRVQYEVEHEGKSFKGDEMLRLSFDQDSLEKIV